MLLVFLAVSPSLPQPVLHLHPLIHQHLTVHPLLAQLQHVDVALLLIGTGQCCAR